MDLHFLRMYMSRMMFLFCLHYGVQPSTAYVLGPSHWYCLTARSIHSSYIMLSFVQDNGHLEKDKTIAIVRFIRLLGALNLLLVTPQIPWLVDLSYQLRVITALPKINTIIWYTLWSWDYVIIFVSGFCSCYLLLYESCVIQFQICLDFHASRIDISSREELKFLHLHPRPCFYANIRAKWPLLKLVCSDFTRKLLCRSSTLRQNAIDRPRYDI